MRLEYLEIAGFKSFAKKTRLVFEAPITAVVGPNGSGKSNVAEAFRWVLGEQSLKSLRGKRGEDLIFNGANSSARFNVASVTICFDNRERTFNLDFDQVIITRTVHRDGVNEYLINGTQVRLRDIIELLANVSLGTTGHHIISQGEADRLLNSNLRERREMIEEALGLKIYHWKISESEKKLTRTEENIKQVESLRREIAPHLKFLKKQVERLEKGDEMRRELKRLYLTYFFHEERYLAEAKASLLSRKNNPATELRQIEARLQELAGVLQNKPRHTQDGRVLELENRLRELRGDKDRLARDIGRLEGLLEIKNEQLNTTEINEIAVPLREVEILVSAVDEKSANLTQISDLDHLKQIVSEIKELVFSFVRRYRSDQVKRSDYSAEIDELTAKRLKLYEQVSALDTEEKDIMLALAEIKQQEAEVKEKTIGAERELYELRAKASEFRAKIDMLNLEQEKFQLEETDFKRELAEAVVLVDQEVSRYHDLRDQVEMEEATRLVQEERRKQIERIKIRLEDLGIEGTDVLEEYKEATKRDEFLGRELTDLQQAAMSLSEVMADLKERLSVEFNAGILKINVAFLQFFGLMFGGGQAELQILKATKRKKKDTDLGLLNLEEMEEAAEEGIEIKVSLPRKKIKGLEMLSGGERALTSIALLFAMSQVNPPPFLILDETDAALDEANSRKYGDMIKSLSKHSQLILITHNRETMSRASILYGVTMGGDGISKLLSIKLDEAENYAK